MLRVEARRARRERRAVTPAVPRGEATACGPLVAVVVEIGPARRRVARKRRAAGADEKIVARNDVAQAVAARRNRERDPALDGRVMKDQQPRSVVVQLEGCVLQVEE